VNQILKIAWREVGRISKRFGGTTSPLVALSFLIVLGFSAFVLRDTITLGSGLYQIGVSGDVLPIHDTRFIVVQAYGEQGRRLLEQKNIDVLIDGTQVFSREDEKSQYAIRALKQYMENAELTRR